jgi:CAAX prenyl protease-like protein
MGVEEVLRITPWLLTILCANVVHYRSLWTARDENRQRVIAQRATSKAKAKQDAASREGYEFTRKQATTSKHELLTFDLMRSPVMRKARYKIKLLRYVATSLYILCFHGLIPELNEHYPVNTFTLECLIAGALSGLITVYLNENQDEAMRTVWRPGHDFDSGLLGDAWDMIRLVGASLAVPVEEELFFHSWMYRYMLKRLHPQGYDSFAGVPFSAWSWAAWIASNAIKGVYNGKEWQSYCISGLLFQWMIGRRGLFLDGLLTHAVSNLTIGCWVLSTNQRQYW